MSSFYGLNKCVQYASLIEIPAAVVQISIDRLQPLLKTSSNDMASLCKLTEQERNGLAHLVSPNFKISTYLPSYVFNLHFFDPYSEHGKANLICYKILRYVDHD